MFEPTTVLLEFLTWFAWLICFGTIQSRICEQYPEIRGLCRKAYVCTMVIPVAASVFLMTRADSGGDLFAVLNHAFGAGVFVQTLLRAVVVLKWLVLSTVPHREAALESGGPLRTLMANGNVAALAGVVVHAVRKQVVPEPSGTAEADDKMAS